MSDPVDPAVYDEAYFLTECEGHEAYLHSEGQELPRRLSLALDMAGDLEGGSILDLGCGRGELVRHAVSAGARAVGIDYSPAALALARRIVPDARALLLRADVRQLPLASDAYDVVFALDLVEHLHPPELTEMLAEARRVLHPGGRLIVHTMPNVWYYRYGYPLFRLLQRLRGQRLPRDPRDRWRYVRHVHVNEQSGPSLARALRAAHFAVRVRYRNAQAFEREPRLALRAAYRLLSTVYPFAWVFCSDLFAIGRKSDG